MEIRQEYRVALEACPAPLILVSRDGRIVLSNQRFSTLFGYDEGELRGQAVEVLVPEEVRSYHPDLLEAFFQVPTSRSMGTGRDLFGVRKDGEKIPVEIGLDSLKLDDDDLVMVSVIDIRDRKEGEARIRKAIDAASSAMVMVNDQGVIELINEKTAEIFGYEHSELIGEPIEILLPDRYRRKHRVYRVSYENTRDRRSMGAGRNLHGLTKDGHEFPVEIGLTPIDGSDGRLVMATIIDITERKMNEEAMRQKGLELQRVNGELSEFAYSASHDLKAPLSSITALLDFVGRDLDEGNLDDVRENVNRARSMASRLAKRIEDILALAKSDRLDRDWEDITIEREVADIWGSLSGDSLSNTVFTTDFRHIGAFQTVAPRFHIIMENLLSNAIKYRDPSKPESTIHVETWSLAGNLMLSVADNGIGIPKEYSEKVFQLFKRVADSDEPGSGIGLALVKKNLMYLGGTIELENTEGGAKFVLTFPQGTEAPGEEPVHTELEVAE